MKKTVLILIVLLNIYLIAQNTKTDSYTNDSEKSIVSMMRKFERTAIQNKLIKPKLKFGLELLRTDKQNQKIFIRKSEYPLEESKRDIYTKYNFNLSIYEGTINIPLEIYNPKKQDIAEKSKKVDEANFKYHLEIIPINKEGDVYTLKLMIVCSEKNVGHFYYKGEKYMSDKAIGFEKTIDLKLGEKIKLDLELTRDRWQIEDVVDHKKVVFDSMQDYYKYFNDYLILSLDNSN